MSRHSSILARLISLFALAVCSASLSDFILRNPAFCDLRDGCSQVTASAYGRPFGIPLPILGLVGFAAIFALTLWSNDRARAFLRALSIAAGLAGLALILIQILVLKKICPLCVCADSAGIALMIVACLNKPNTAQLSRSIRTWKVRAIWTVIALSAITVPLLWASLRSGPTLAPSEVKAHWIAGRVTIVEVGDFECHHCAKADKILKAALRDAKDVHFVRLPAPMPTHPNSWAAARAYLAAQRQGKGEEMAEALFGAESRSAEECRSFAVALHLRMDEYDLAIIDPATDAELKKTVDWAIKWDRLPLIWVQNRLFDHVPSPAELQEAIRDASASHH